MASKVQSVGMTVDTKNQAVILRCNEIDPHSFPNARVAAEEEGGEDDSKGMKGIAASIALKSGNGPTHEGQDTPIVVRPHPDKSRKDGKVFELIAGFQRFAAITGIASGELAEPLKEAGISATAVLAKQTKTPMIRAVVKNLSDEEARFENLTENLLRNDLSASDVSFGVSELFKVNSKLSDSEVARRLGRNQPYISKLRRIHKGFAGCKIPADALHKGSAAIPVLAHWRVANNPKPTTEDMNGVATNPNMSNEEKVNAYLVLAGFVKGEKGKKGATGRSAWIPNATEEMKTIGYVMGKLQKAGMLDAGEELFTGPNILLMLSMAKRKASKDGVSEDALEGIAFAGNEAFQAALTGKDEAEEEEAEETASKPIEAKKASGKKAAKGKSKANGVAATR